MALWQIVGLAMLAIVVACIVISFYFKKKEEFYYGKLERETKEQNPKGGC